jgi:hypothetical protein
MARSLECDWNEKLAAVERLERASAAVPRPAQLVASLEEQTRILRLAQDFPAIWRASTTHNAERKQFLRSLIRDVTLTRRETHIHLGVHWQTGAVSESLIPRRKRIDEIWHTPDEVIAPHSIPGHPSHGPPDRRTVQRRRADHWDRSVL